MSMTLDIIYCTYHMFISSVHIICSYHMFMSYVGIICWYRPTSHSIAYHSSPIHRYDSDSSNSHDGKHTKGGVAVKQTKGAAKTQNGKVVAGKKTKVVGGKVVYYDSDSDHSHKSHGSHSSKGSHKSHGSKGSKGSKGCKKHDKHHHHDDKHKDKHDHDVKYGTVGKTTVVKGPQGNTAAKQTKAGVAHNGHNGATTAGKQTKAAVKTDNGVAAGQKTTVGRFGRR